MQKDLLSLRTLTPAEFENLITTAMKFKAARKVGVTGDQPLRGKSVGMIFGKSSTRTRVSFEVGVYELGGHALYLDQGKLQLGRGESIYDTAHVMSRYLHGIVIRTFSHADVVELAENSDIPIINALTDTYHPCQVLADIMTIREYSGKTQGVKMTFVGDGACNMPNSLMIGSIISGIDLTIAAPEAYKPRFDLIKGIKGPGSVTWEPDVQKAVRGAQYLYTDVWVSMGCEAEAEERIKALTPYQINADLIKLAVPDVKIMHCLPAKRGEEVTGDVLDSSHSIIYDEAENRLHAQKAVLAKFIR